MIIGNGLIARSLSPLASREETVFFASGVSNSYLVDDSAFERERLLLREVGKVASRKSQVANKDLGLGTGNLRLVYFSTCSIHDKSSLSKPYIKHKLEMESIIAGEFESWLVVRLPTVVGKTGNPYTFFNFFRDKINKRESVDIHTGAWRYLFDADDLAEVMESLLAKNLRNVSLNAAFPNAMSVEEIIRHMEQCLGSEARKSITNQGDRFSFSQDEFMSALPAAYHARDWKKYTVSLIRKYCL